MLISITRDIVSGVLDLLYPPFCLICEKPGNAILCAECIEKIDLIGKTYCHTCGTPYEGYECKECRDRTYAFEFARAAGVFDGPLREAIHKLKYGGYIMIADPLAEIMVRCLPDTTLIGKVDLVVPIPIHRSRIPERGFNQAEELARRFCNRVGLPIATDVLIKKKKTRHQVNLSMDERGINLQGAFAVKNAAKLAGKRVLLIDDVFTTGATLNEAATTLRESGAKQVYAYTLARSI